MFRKTKKVNEAPKPETPELFPQVGLYIRNEEQKLAYSRSREEIVIYYNNFLFPKFQMAQGLLSRQNVRLSRCHSAVDMFGAAEADFLQKAYQFEMSWVNTPFNKESVSESKHLRESITHLRSKIMHLYNNRLEQDKKEFVSREVFHLEKHKSEHSLLRQLKRRQLLQTVFRKIVVFKYQEVISHFRRTPHLHLNNQLI